MVAISIFVYLHDWKISFVKKKYQKVRIKRYFNILQLKNTNKKVHFKAYASNHENPVKINTVKKNIYLYLCAKYMYLCLDTNI